MKTARSQIIILFILLLLPVKALSDIVVIVNPANEITTLTKRQVVDLYMGRESHFPNGTRPLRFDQPNSSAIRTRFYYQLTEMPLASINAYWARLVFTGRAAAPLTLSSNKEMLEVVEKNQYAIGYVDKKDLNDRVKVIFVLNQAETE